MKSQSGFTLIEIIIVMAMSGILMAITVQGITREIQASNLRAANSQIVADLDRLRTSSVRTSTDSSMIFNTNKKSYTLDFGNGQTQVINLPSNVVLDVTKPNNTTTMTSFTYSAPYATVGATGLSFTLSVPNTNLSKQFYLLGVTGKVNQ